jgi:hypothetical protein
MIFERIWIKVASPKPFPPMAKVVQTLRAYEPFDQIVSEVAATLAHVRDVSSEVEDLKRNANRLRVALLPSKRALENSSPSKRDMIAAIMEELNQDLDEFLEKLEEYHGEEGEAAEGVLWERTFLKRKLATCIHKDAARINDSIVTNIKSIERWKPLLIQ